MTHGLVSPLSMTVPHPLSSALHVAAFGCIVFAFLFVESLQFADSARQLWPAVLLLLPLASLLWSLQHAETTENAFAYLLGGGVIVSLFSSIVMASVDFVSRSDNAPHMLVKVALLLGGGPGSGIISAISWPIAAFLVGEGAVRAAALQVGGDVETDVTTFFALVAVVAARLIASVLARPNMRVRTALRQAARQEERAMARARVELSASALLHDTVLRDLTHLTVSGPGPLNKQLSQRLRLDLDLLAQGAWASAAYSSSSAEDTVASPDLHAVVTAVREHGLVVDVSGDISALSLVTDDQRLAIAMAVYQCLVNVSEHSGVEKAEVTIARAAFSVSVMVVDAGRGFRLSDTAPDRLGLRQSVVRRMVDAGGNGRIWSTPGRGTAVQLVVPIGGPNERR